MRTTATFLSVALASASLCSGYNLYYANLHSHTSYSSGAGTPAWAFAYARDTASIDILAVTDHAELLSQTEWEDTKVQAAAATIPGVFLGLAGFEWTSSTYGHANVYCTDDFTTAQLTTTPESLYAWCARRPGSLTQFNHIAPGDFRSFRYSAPGDRSFALCEGQIHFRYAAVLDSGWHVGATQGQDNHTPDWGMRKQRTGIWAGNLTRDSILDALRKMRTFRTQDRNASVEFRANGTWQGGTIANGRVQFDVIFADADTQDWFSYCNIVTNGGQVAAHLVPGYGNRVEWHPVITTDSGEQRYFFAVSYVGDTNVIFSAPIWTEPVRSQYDVASVSILAPGDTVDSGAAVTPACSVRNCGAATPGSYLVRMKVCSYNRTATVTGPAPGTATYVTFPTWIVDSCGTFAVSCSTELAADECRDNDKATTTTTVPLLDVGVAKLLRPVVRYDSSGIVVPVCSTRNYGARAASYRVRLRIGTYYNQPVSVSGHATGTAKYVTFPRCTLRYNGRSVVSCSTELTGDDRPSNDRQTASITVGPLDAACVSIRAPRGTLDSNTIVTPACTVQNNSVTAQSIPAGMKVGTFYGRTATTPRIGPGIKCYLTFPPCTLKVTATQVVSCSTLLTSDARPANDKKTDSVIVTESLFEPPPHDGTVPGEAVAKDGISIDPSPLASGLAALRYCLPRAGAAAVNIYNVAGQSVMAQTLAVGRSGVVNLDMRRLSSGVYVVKFRSGDLVATKKLVVQRH